MILRLSRSLALALVLSTVLLWPFLVMAEGGNGRSLFDGRELCYAAGVECGPGNTLGSVLLGSL